MNDLKFMTMKEIGALKGLTSHQIGRTLKQFGLREATGEPSPRAISEGFVDQRWYDEVTRFGWTWHVEKVGKLLDEPEINHGQSA